MERLQVGKNCKNPTRKNRRQITYSDLKKDKDGWIRIEEGIPQAFDLCLLKFENEYKFGWWNGRSWDGYKIKEGESPLYWKKKGD